MSDLEELKILLDTKVKISESFKISKSGKTITNINRDHCQPDFYFPECLCISDDMSKVSRLESVLINYARKRYPKQCENPDNENKIELEDQNNGIYMLYLAVRRPSGNFFK